MDNIAVRLFQPQEIMGKAESIARLFADIFAAPPWNEVFRCTRCGKRYGPDGTNEHRCCGMTLVDCFPIVETTAMIQEYLRKPQARIALVCDSDRPSDMQIYGFAWGWVEPLMTIGTEQLKLLKSQLEVLISANALSPDEDVFYIDEIGVDPQVRGKGFGRKLFNVLFQDDSFIGIRVITRTSRQSVAYHIATTNTVLPFQTAFDYEDGSDCVVLLSPPIISSTKVPG